MRTFGFILHPIRIEDVRNHWGVTKWIPNFLLKKILQICPPFVVSHIEKVRSINNEEVEGYVSVCPLLPMQMLKLKEKAVLHKIIAAGKLVKERGASIVGLGGYTSIVGDKGYTIARNLSIPVTSGNTLTAWAVIEAILESAKKRGVETEKSTLSIIGATGSIGTLCTKKLSSYFSKIVITARHRDKLLHLKNEVERIGSAHIDIETDVREVVKRADVIIVTTSAPEALIDGMDVKRNAILCDVSLPKNIYGKTNTRKDITIIEGGLVQVPHRLHLGFQTDLPHDVLFGCIAETVLLTLEERFKNYSLGDRIAVERLDDIAAMALRHGFKPYLKIQRDEDALKER